MTSLTMAPHLARALYQEALALAHLAREQTTSPPQHRPADSPFRMPHVEAMPAVSDLVHLVSDLMELTEKLERQPSARGPIPGDVTAGTAPLAARQPCTPEFLGTQVKEIRRRYERLRHAVADDLSSSPEAASGAPVPAADPAEGKPSKQSAGKRALVIDDDEVYRLLVARTLSDRSWTVDEAADGHMGWQMFQLTDYDLVITDILMPLQDGLETIQMIRSRRPGVRIVAVSGGGALRADYLFAALHFGADKTLPKPFSPANLLAAVEPGESVDA